MGRADHLAQYRFKPGQSGNPAGRAPMSEDEKELRKWTRENIADTINTIGELNDKEVETLLSDPDASQLYKIVAKVMLESRKTGDMTQLDRLLDRCIGKVPQKIEGNPDAPIGFMVLRTPPERKKDGAPEELRV